ncbi:MAG: hypothetical protein L6R40_004071 [Gallowayella cf. fulva]|nr:MAG: hypothetical protein L6R40_004071 [Xanthomendoza cf. fulva]
MDHPPSYEESTSALYPHEPQPPVACQKTASTPTQLTPPSPTSISKTQKLVIPSLHRAALSFPYTTALSTTSNIPASEWQDFTTVLSSSVQLSVGQKAEAIAAAVGAGVLLLGFWWRRRRERWGGFWWSGIAFGRREA